MHPQTPRSVLIFGANSAIARALAAHWRQTCTLIGVGRRPAQAADAVYHHWYTTDYSEADLGQLVAHLQARFESVGTLLCAVGLLHAADLTPEKKLADLNQQQLSAYFQVNAVLPALILRYCQPLVARALPSRLVFLSAKVAGISDNRLGGWYGYRASKAALNMLIKTASVELARSHRQACLVALHPGPTASPLSQPFAAAVPAGQYQTAEQTAQRLSRVIDALRPEDSGRFLHWDGTDLPW